MSVARGPFALAAILLSGLILGGGAEAAPFKCVDEKSGHVTYTDMACPQARERKDLVLVDNASDSSADQRALAAQGHRSPPSLPSGPMTLGTSRPLRGESTSSCAASKRDYEIAVGTIKKDLVLMNRRYREAMRACGKTFEVLPGHEAFATEQVRAKHDGSTRVGASRPLPIVSE